jgi:ferrous iron transport protein A
VKLTLSQLTPHETCTVSEIRGGQGLVNRLYALGIRPGKKITKVSSLFSNGPVTILVDRAQVAIGRGMAGKIIVTSEDH